MKRKFHDDSRPVYQTLRRDDDHLKTAPVSSDDFRRFGCRADRPLEVQGHLRTPGGADGIDSAGGNNAAGSV